MRSRNIFVCALVVGMATFCSCSKSSDNGSSNETFTTTEEGVISAFVSNTALPQYANLVAAGTKLNTDITTLSTTPTDANLKAAQADWKAMRLVWERCEGFLIGPVEDNGYDPNSDTWPTDYHQMDSLLASVNTLTPTDVSNLSETLRGYHPIEYLIFGKGGSRTVAELDDRKMKYLVSLSDDMLNNNVKPLQNDWTSGSSPYSAKVTSAGPNNSVFSSRQALFLDLATDLGMAGICNEVGQQNEDGKMYNPYITKDSTLAESPYSGNSLTDFKNNIVGVQQVYMGLNGGKGFKDLVAARNKDLDNRIQAAITTAVNSFDNISGSDNMRYELAIFDRRTQIQATLTALNNLQDLLETELVAYIKQYVKD